MFQNRYFNTPWPYLVAAIATGLYFGLSPLGDWLGRQPNYANYADRDIPMTMDAIQRALVYPWSKWLNTHQRHWVVLPWWLALSLGFRAVYLHSRRVWIYTFKGGVLLLILLYIFPNSLLWFENDLPSRSTGSSGSGSIENAKRMPFRGKNFTTYSFPGYLMGRTYVHDKVRAALLDAYSDCAVSCPGVKFVIGETGLKKGGRFLPHRSHRNGMSVDLMTPMLKNGKPWRSHHIFNLWGYAMEFDQKGKWKKAEIDYETLARHLLAIRESAKEQGLKIRRVIFDPNLQPELFSTAAGEKIKNLPFNKSQGIIRHDDHYHVDFE